MDVMVADQDRPVEGRALRRRGRAGCKSACVAWLLVAGLVTGCGGVPLEADPNQAVPPPMSSWAPRA